MTDDRSSEPRQTQRVVLSPLQVEDAKEMDNRMVDLVHILDHRNPLPPEPRLASLDGTQPWSVRAGRWGKTAPRAGHA